MKKQNFFLEILSTVSKYFLGFILFIIVCLMCSGIRIIDSGNVALILRFGHLVGNTYEEQVHEPGLLFAFPSFIDEVIIIPSDKVIEQSVTTHYTDSKGNTGWDGGYLITGDQNIAVVSASIKYTVKNPVTYALNIKDIGKIVDSTVSTAMLNEAANVAVDDLLTSKKDEYGQNIKKFVSEKMDNINSGIEIVSVELTKVAMPGEVKIIYDEVNSANLKRETMLEEARLQSQNIITEANKKYDTLISQSNNYYENETSQATKEMAEFWGYFELIVEYNSQLEKGEITNAEYENIKQTLIKRVSSEKVMEAINKIGTVRVVQDGETKIIINP